MIKQKIEEDLKKVLKDLGFKTCDIVLSIPQNPSFGDYSSNIALQLSKSESTEGKQSTMEIANEIVEKLKSLDSARDNFYEIKTAGPGFINFFIKNEVLLKNLDQVANLPKIENPLKILIEFGHCNAFKEFHTGHLRTHILGESLARILGSLGNDVFRANYQGDIGPHVAKAIWGMEKLGIPSGKLSLEEKARFLGQAYIAGNIDYDENPEAKNQIDQINTALYQKDPKYQKFYEIGREWSLEYFEAIYGYLGIKYDRLFFETEVFEAGKKLVLENTDGIFEKSEGAIIFPGEKYGLHNRVFLNSLGNPTYEAKEIGLAELEYKTFNYDRSIHVVGSEQAGYFQVVFKALELLFKHLQGKKYHLSYGMVSFKEGKMSSRTGNIVTIDDLIRAVAEKVKEVVHESRLEVDAEVLKKIAIGAIKFSYLKFAPTSNLVFDIGQSVSLQGDSGPYLQYTYARIHSVLEKSGFKNMKFNLENLVLEPEERMLLVRLEYFGGVVEQVSKELRPNLICEYLLDLAKDFNLFYQKHRIIESEKKDLRLTLTFSVGEVLKAGLNLLGIEAPDKM